MKEEQKDTVEFVASQVAAGALELLPGGSLLSRALLAPAELADRKRTQRALDEIVEKLRELERRGRLTDLDGLIQSDEFLARLTQSFRAMQETASAEKRQMLRNALLNAQTDDVSADVAEHFSRVTARYTPLHVHVLRLVEPLQPFVSREESFPENGDGKRSGIMRDLPEMCRAAFPEHIALVDAVLSDLRSDSLIARTQPITYDLQDTGDPQRADAITDLGRAFLFILRDPMD